MEIIKQITEKYDVYFSEESVQEFNNILEPKEYKKDEIILSPGQISKYMYVIQKGIIRQFYYKEGRDITEHFSCEGQIATCLESLFLKEPSKLGVESLESSLIYLLDYEKWEHLCDKNPQINQLHRRVLEYKLVVSQQKADSWRFENSSERYERFCNEYPQIVKRAAVAHIASYLLMSPETLSRVRAGVL